MSNTFDQNIVLEAAEGMVVFRNLSTETDLLHVYWYALDPNGVLTAPQGSIVSGAASAWLNTDGGTTWVDLAAASGQTLSYVFRPGEPAPANNIYATWAALYADFNAVAVRDQARTIIVDTSLAAAVVPAGTYDLTNSTLAGFVLDNNAGQTVLTFADGAVVTGWPSVVRSLALLTNSTNPVCTLSTTSRLTFIDCGMAGNAGVAPLLEIDGVAVLMDWSCPFTVSSNNSIQGEAIGGAVGGGSLRLSVSDNAEVQADAFTGLLTVIIEYDCSVRVIDTQTAPGFVGTLTSRPIGEIEPTTAPNEAYIDTTLSTDYPVRRAFTTVAAALAAGFTQCRLREGQAHTWPGTGLTVDGVTFVSSGRAAITWSNVIATDGPIVFKGVSVAIPADITSTVAHAVTFDSCTVSSTAGARLVDFGSITAIRTKFVGTRFNTVASKQGVSFDLCDWEAGSAFPTTPTPPVFSFDGVLTHKVTNCHFDLPTMNTNGVVNPLNDYAFAYRSAGNVGVTFNGCTFSVGNAGSNNLFLFGGLAAANFSVSMFGSTVAVTTGDVRFGAAFCTPVTPMSLSWQGVAALPTGGLPSGSWYNNAGAITAA